MIHKINSFPRALSLGISLLLAVFLPIVFCCLSWIAGFSLSWWEFPLSVILSMCTAWRLSGSWRCAIYLLIYIIVSLLLSGLIFEYAYDSIGYHKPTVVLLTEGWNPLEYHNYPNVIIWSLHYAKLLEIAASSIYAFTGILEQGKAVNLLLVGSLISISYDTFKNLGLSNKNAFLVIFVMLCNPVLTTQMFTFYIDFSLYVYLSVTLLTIINIHIRHYVCLNCSILFLITVMAIGTKFNIFFYQGFAMITAVVWFLYQKDYETFKKILIVGLSGLGASLILFIHPYITNWLGWGNPLFPLVGDGCIDIMSKNTPDLYQGNNRFVNFFLNLFSTDSRLFPFTNYDSRVGGFSHIGGILLIFSFSLLVMGYKKFPSVVYYTIFIILLSCFCFEQAWWARYIPQLWLIPTITIFCELKYGTKYPILLKIFIAIVVCVLFLSGIPQFCTHLIHSIQQK